MNKTSSLQCMPTQYSRSTTPNILESLSLHLFHPSQLKVYKPSEIKKVPLRNDFRTLRRRSQKKISETTRELSLIYLPLISVVLTDQEICSNYQGDNLEDRPF